MLTNVLVVIKWNTRYVSWSLVKELTRRWLHALHKHNFIKMMSDVKATIQHKILRNEENSGRYLGRELSDTQSLEFICFPSAWGSGKFYDTNSQTGAYFASVILTGKFAACHGAAWCASIPTSHRAMKPHGCGCPSAPGPLSMSLWWGIISVKACNAAQWHMLSFH